jgi:hypothetical protein
MLGQWERPEKLIRCKWLCRCEGCCRHDPENISVTLGHAGDSDLLPSPIPQPIPGLGCSPVKWAVLMVLKGGAPGSSQLPPHSQGLSGLYSGPGPGASWLNRNLASRFIGVASEVRECLS